MIDQELAQSLKAWPFKEAIQIIKKKPIDRRSDSLILTSEGNLLVNNIIKIIKNQEDEIFDKLGSEIFNFTNSLKLILGKKIRIRAK